MCTNWLSAKGRTAHRIVLPYHIMSHLYTQLVEAVTASYSLVKSLCMRIMATHDSIV